MAIYCGNLSLHYVVGLKSKVRRSSNLGEFSLTLIVTQQPPSSTEPIETEINLYGTGENLRSALNAMIDSIAAAAVT